MKIGLIKVKNKSKKNNQINILKTKTYKIQSKINEKVCFLKQFNDINIKNIVRFHISI